ncbi:alpha/beta fold hydrolase [Microbacterium hatanonis]|uniref:Alpha/beta hydrolase n=1 Tax=Microbacterium hatanonis TaxID=404366 RepID=A0A5C8HUQ1_9MICO|nr:alpha/beta hydrolase [Microbacterium hatanonis]
MYVDAGEGDEPVLMLHGAGVSGWMWEPVRALLPPGMKAIVPDLPGFGRSANLPYVSHTATVGELRGILERHAPHGAHVVGFSLGAQLAILLAAEFPQLVRSVTVVSAETKPAPLPGYTLALLALAAPLSRQRWFARAQARQLGIPEQFWDEYLRDSASTSRDTLIASVGENIRFTLPATWSEYRGPVGILVGARERKLMHDSAALTASALPGSSLRTVEGSAHDVPLTNPHAIASELKRKITP